jgi:hypothetical protein
VAKRRTRQQIDADKIIKAQLNELGEKVFQQAKNNSRVDTGRLRDSVNYMVKPDTVLTVAQVFYGRFQDPNELEVSINNNVDETINLVVKEIVDQITQDYDS